MKAYTLKKMKESDELHLFEGEMKPDNRNCTSALKSVCKKMDASDSQGNVFACLREKEARLRCAEEGRKVCGTCVSHLYTTY